MNPSIREIPTPFASRSRRFRVEGGTLRADWAASVRPGRVAWCEITVHDFDGAPWIGAFGGEVWPSAWPHLFAPQSNANGTRPSHCITDDGIVALQAAVEVAEGEMGAEVDAAREDEQLRKGGVWG